MFPCHYRLELAGDKEEGEGILALDPRSVTLAPQGGSALSIFYHQLLSLQPNDYSLAVRLEGGNLVLSRLGPALAEVQQSLWTFWCAALGAGLFHEGEPRLGRLPGFFQSGGEAAAGVALLYPGVLLILREGLDVSAWPVRSWKSTRFEENTYEIVLETENKLLYCGRLGRRSAEFAAACARALADCQGELSRLVGQSLPEANALAVRRLSAMLWQDLAWTREKTGEDWATLRKCLTSAERAPFLDELERLAQPGGLFCGLAPAPARLSESPSLSWFSALLGKDTLAMEVSSADEGFATYLFRLPGGKDSAQLVRRIHLEWPLAGFHRDLVALDEATLQLEQNRHWLMTLRLLPALAWMRRNFLGKVIHSEVETWKNQIAQIAGI